MKKSQHNYNIFNEYYLHEGNEQIILGSWWLWIQINVTQNPLRVDCIQCSQHWTSNNGSGALQL